MNDTARTADDWLKSIPAPLAFGHDYPEPAFSVLPGTVGNDTPRGRHVPKGATATILSTCARYCLALIAKAELRQGDTVLLPAYHCPALVEPFLWAGCNIKFYSMNADLSPIEEKLLPDLKSARAVVLVRFFGFSGNIASLAQLARSHNCLVIEDLAHAPFVRELYGHYGVTSLVKFYPVKAGAETWIAEDGNIDAISQTLSDYRLGPATWELLAFIRRARKKLSSQANNGKASNNLYRYFRVENLREPVSPAITKEIACHDDARIINSRKKNYHFLNQLLADSSLGRPLFPTLTDDDVPYVYPFLLEDAATFDSIKNARIPLFRWEELAPTTCEISKIYRSRLIQIPCHQDLTDENLELMEQTFKELA